MLKNACVLCKTCAFRTVPTESVGFVENQDKAIFFSEIGQKIQIGTIAIHSENSLGRYEHWAVGNIFTQ